MEEDRHRVSSECSSVSIVSDDASPPANPYSQVVFSGLSESYDPSSPVRFHFRLKPGTKSQEGDWIGIFPIGWTDTSEFIAATCVNSENEGDEISSKVQIDNVKETAFYQLCYVTAGNFLAGCSLPFNFKRKTRKNSKLRSDNCKQSLDENAIKKLMARNKELEKQLLHQSNPEVLIKTNTTNPHPNQENQNLRQPITKNGTDLLNDSTKSLCAGPSFKNDEFLDIITGERVSSLNLDNNESEWVQYNINKCINTAQNVEEKVNRHHNTKIHREVDTNISSSINHSRKFCDKDEDTGSNQEVTRTNELLQMKLSKAKKMYDNEVRNDQELFKSSVIFSHIDEECNSLDDAITKLTHENEFYKKRLAAEQYRRLKEENVLLLNISTEYGLNEALKNNHGSFKLDEGNSEENSSVRGTSEISIGKHVNECVECENYRVKVHSLKTEISKMAVELIREKQCHSATQHELQEANSKLH